MSTATESARAIAAVAAHLEGLEAVSVSLAVYPWATTPTVDMLCEKVADALALATRLGLDLDRPRYLTAADGRVHCNWYAVRPEVEYRVAVILPAGTADLDAAVAAEQLAATP